jgi:hypothetical protein
MTRLRFSFLLPTRLLFVIPSVDSHVTQLGFAQAWRCEADGKGWVARVDRLIGLLPKFASHKDWPRRFSSCMR